MINTTWYVSGAISGIFSAVFFVFIHNWLIAPIWFIFPFAVIFGVLTGLGLSTSYLVIFKNISRVNSLKLFLLYLLPVVLLDVGIWLFVDPIFVIPEITDDQFTSLLLRTAFLIVIPYAIVYGMLQGYILGHRRETYVVSVGTNLTILGGIAHNFPIFNLVIVNDTEILRIHVFSIWLLIVLSLCYFVSFHIFNWYAKKRSEKYPTTYVS